MSVNNPTIIGRAPGVSPLCIDIGTGIESDIWPPLGIRLNAPERVQAAPNMDAIRS